MKNPIFFIVRLYVFPSLGNHSAYLNLQCPLFPLPAFERSWLQQFPESLGCLSFSFDALQSQRRLRYRILLTLHWSQRAVLGREEAF